MLRRTLYVAYFLEVGLLLVLVPWSSFWERNYFVTLMPSLVNLLRNNYLRGAVSGMGVVNLLVGFYDLSDLLMARRFGETMSREAT
jgi:hypothetical protein